MPSVGTVLRDCHVPWPAANEGSLREAAAIWHQLAETIRDDYGPANTAARSLTSNNEGAAIRAFEDYWDQFSGSKGVLLLGAEACDSMSNICTKYADEVAEAKRKLEEAGAEIAATLVIGTIGAIFTFGATEGAADIAAAGLASTAASAMGTLLAWVADNAPAAFALVDALDTAVAALGTDTGLAVVSSTLSGAASGLGSTIFADTADDSIRQLYGEKPLSASEVGKDLIIGGLGGGAGGLLGQLGELAAPKLATLVSNAAGSVSESNPQLFVEMMELSKQLRGTVGKVTSGVLASVAGQLITAQQIDAAGVASDQLSDLIKRAGEGGEE